MKTVHPSNLSMLAIECCDCESVIYNYFSLLNGGKFLETAELFEVEGCLKPPFEKLIQGRSAIAQYLKNEALGMRLYPENIEILTRDLHHTQYQIIGKVKTNYFTVNVSWLIHLNAKEEITIVEIRLLGSLTELLMLNRS
jgi:hypothetical protein